MCCWGAVAHGCPSYFQFSTRNTQMHPTLWMSFGIPSHHPLSKFALRPVQGAGFAAVRPLIVSCAQCGFWGG